MIRGTTPTLEIVVDCDVDLLAEVHVTIQDSTGAQIDKTGAEVTKTRMSETQGTLAVTLTQAETLSLTTDGGRPGYAVVQVRALFADGTAAASDIFALPVERILKEGVIGGD